MQLKLHMVTIEDLVPQEHFLRKLDAALDLSFIRTETADLYSHRYGRPATDPVVLVKYLLLGYLYGIPSERQIEVHCRERMPFRWYLGLDIDSPVPDHSTISQNRRRRPKLRKLFRRLFEEVVGQCITSGLVSGRLVTTDSTHIKANASRASEYLADAPETPGAYWERLDHYEEEGLELLREKTGQRRKKRTKQVRSYQKHPQRRMSRTDPESGHLNRPGKPKGPHYLCHTSQDTDHGIILDVAATPGNANDSTPYLAQLERIHRELIPIQAATADAAYDFPLAHRTLEELGIFFYVRQQKQGESPSDKFPQRDFAYDEAQDCFRCPAGNPLRLNTLRRSEGGLHWVYLADKRDCGSCPLRAQCLSEGDKRGARKIERNYFAEAAARDFSRLETPAYRDALRKRQIWSEGTFAAQKWGHNLTRVLRRGLEAAEDHCLLSATALNL
ncbi:MAG: IS1182 family transposase [Oscillospiraceae bacterium]